MIAICQRSPAAKCLLTEFGNPPPQHTGPKCERLHVNIRNSSIIPTPWQGTQVLRTNDFVNIWAPQEAKFEQKFRGSFGWNLRASFGPHLLRGRIHIQRSQIPQSISIHYPWLKTSKTSSLSASGVGGGGKPRGRRRM